MDLHQISIEAGSRQPPVLTGRRTLVRLNRVSATHILVRQYPVRVISWRSMTCLRSLNGSNGQQQFLAGCFESPSAASFLC
jgi:hypothetical protein